MFNLPLGQATVSRQVPLNVLYKLSSFTGACPTALSILFIIVVFVGPQDRSSATRRKSFPRRESLPSAYGAWPIGMGLYARYRGNGLAVLLIFVLISPQDRSSATRRKSFPRRESLPSGPSYLRPHQSAGPLGRLLAGARRRRPSSCAFCPLSASRGACACAICRRHSTWPGRPCARD
jgi:hypothetical protein